MATGTYRDIRNSLSQLYVEDDRPWLHFDLKQYINFSKLQKTHIMLRAPQSVMEVTDEKYRQIIKEGGLDERFTLH